MTDKQCHLALMFEPDGYDVSKKELMGRQTAGYAFLRAATNICDVETEYLTGYTARRGSFDALQNMANTLKPGLEARWCQPHQLSLLQEAGTLYLPDPGIASFANTRLRIGVDAYSITGVTHTTATHRVLDFFKDLVTAPVMPWDALISTSRSVHSTVETVLESQRDYLSWRLGTDVPTTPCQLPVIPLGIHTQDFEFSAQFEKDARRKMDIEDNEIVFLFLGRLTTFMKAHVFPMYQGLQKVAEATGKNITLIECGWFATDSTEDAMVEARGILMPDVKYIHIDGREVPAKNRCWAAADVFVSLSDNIQETFGLTPVEAMAAGLPLLISQWDGYAELCSDGEEGFQIPTTMPDDTIDFAYLYETNAAYSKYCVTTAQTISVDVGCFIQRATALAENPELRATMGAKGKLRAKTIYDWSVVYEQYQDLWQELAAIRKNARTAPGLGKVIKNIPDVIPGRQSPSELFSSYPSQFITDDTCIIAEPTGTPGDYAKLIQLKIFTFSGAALPFPPVAKIIFKELEAKKTLSVTQIATLLGCNSFAAKKIVSTLLKMGLVTLH